jgi:hypothetical protein
MTLRMGIEVLPRTPRFTLPMRGEFVKLAGSPARARVHGEGCAPLRDTSADIPLTAAERSGPHMGS